MTFAISDRNPNSKIRRWNAFIDEYNANIYYKPGKENHVADALSRHNIHNLGDDAESDVATIHSEVSLTYTIESSDKPINYFRNQIVIEESRTASDRTIILFGEKIRHLIQFSNKDSLIEKICEVVKKDVVNAIHCELPILAFIQHKLVETFPSTAFRYTKFMVSDIINKNEQNEIVTAEHNRAHRAAQENVKQILQDYFFPKMTKLAIEVATNCKICKTAKYDRHPQKQILGETPIPSHVGEMLHIDIYSTDKKCFLTCIDKFSKFAIV